MAILFSTNKYVQSVQPVQPGVDSAQRKCFCLLNPFLLWNCLFLYSVSIHAWSTWLCVWHWDWTELRKQVCWPQLWNRIFHNTRHTSYMLMDVILRRTKNITIGDMVPQYVSINHQLVRPIFLWFCTVCVPFMIF